MWSSNSSCSFFQRNGFGCPNIEFIARWCAYKLIEDSQTSRVKLSGETREIRAQSLSRFCIQTVNGMEKENRLKFTIPARFTVAGLVDDHWKFQDQELFEQKINAVNGRLSSKRMRDEDAEWFLARVRNTIRDYNEQYVNVTDRYRITIASAQEDGDDRWIMMNLSKESHDRFTSSSTEQKERNLISLRDRYVLLKETGIVNQIESLRQKWNTILDHFPPLVRNKLGVIVSAAFDHWISDELHRQLEIETNEILSTTTNNEEVSLGERFIEEREILKSALNLIIDQMNLVAVNSDEKHRFREYLLMIIETTKDFTVHHSIIDHADLLGDEFNIFGVMKIILPQILLTIIKFRIHKKMIKRGAASPLKDKHMRKLQLILLDNVFGSDAILVRGEKITKELTRVVKSKLEEEKEWKSIPHTLNRKISFEDKEDNEDEDQDNDRNLSSNSGPKLSLKQIENPKSGTVQSILKASRGGTTLGLGNGAKREYLLSKIASEEETAKIFETIKNTVESDINAIKDRALKEISENIQFLIQQKLYEFSFILFKIKNDFKRLENVTGYLATKERKGTFLLINNVSPAFLANKEASYWRNYYKIIAEASCIYDKYKAHYAETKDPEYKTKIEVSKLLKHAIGDFKRILRLWIEDNLYKLLTTNRGFKNLLMTDNVEYTFSNLLKRLEKVDPNEQDRKKIEDNQNLIDFLFNLQFLWEELKKFNSQKGDLSFSIIKDSGVKPALAIPSNVPEEIRNVLSELMDSTIKEEACASKVTDVEFKLSMKKFSGQMASSRPGGRMNDHQLSTNEPATTGLLNLNSFVWG